ncbi:MAG: hypothetical protein AAGG44_06820, partial [Planctomycetota bacterium]
IKPANILVGNQNEVLLVDWGIAGYTQDGVVDSAKADTLDEPRQTQTTQDEAIASDSVLEEAQANGRLTVAGMRLGTPAFMSPEQLDAPQLATTRSDVYSLGATLFFSLNGRAPQQELTADWGPPHELTAICEKALSSSASQRYESSAALAEDLENWLAGEPVVAFPEGIMKKAMRWCIAHRSLVLTATAACFVAFALLMVFVLQELRVQEAKNEKLEQESLADQRLYRSSMIVLATSKELNSHAIFSDAPDDPEKEELRIAIRKQCYDMLSDGCADRQAELHLHIAMCSARLKDFSTARTHTNKALEKLSKLEHMPELESLELDAQLLNAELLLRAGKHVAILKLVKSIEQNHDLEPPERWHYSQGFQLMRGFAFAALKQNYKAAEALGAVANSEVNQFPGSGMLPPFQSSMNSSLNMPAAVFYAGQVCQARAQLASMIIWQRQPTMWNVFSATGFFSFSSLPRIELERVFFESPSGLGNELWNMEEGGNYEPQPEQPL